MQSYENLNKEKVYCSHCFKEDTITELDLNYNETRYNPCTKHSYIGSNYRVLKYYNNEWKTCRGLSINSKPQIHGLFHNKCNNCGYEEDSRASIIMWKCPKCNWVPDNSLYLKNRSNWTYKHKCNNKECSKYNIEIKDNVLPMNWRCNDCGSKEKSFYKCKKCGSTIDTPVCICKICGYDPHADFNFECSKCKTKLKCYNEVCPNCGNVNTTICSKCGNEIETGKKCKYCGYDPLYEHRAKQAKINLEQNTMFGNFPNPNWLNLSIKEKITEEERWIKENLDSKLLCYHKRNLELLKLKQSGQYEYTFSDIKDDPDLDNSNMGWIYGHIDTRTNELYYIGQTIQTPIERYTEHLQVRKKGLTGNDQRFTSSEEYSKITGITQERINNTKVVILHKLNKLDFESEEEFKQTLNELEQNCIKNFIPKMNFYMIDNI